MNKKLAGLIILSSLMHTGLSVKTDGVILINSGYTKTQLEALERKRLAKLRKYGKRVL